jgi:hypothetical protein
MEGIEGRAATVQPEIKQKRKKNQSIHTGKELVAYFSSSFSC